MRLTKKVSVGYNPAPQKYGSRAIYNKLGQLEDIEEELGIDLITLFKAQTIGFYVKTACGIFPVLLGEWRFNLIKKEVHRIKFSSHYYFKDYGITWALTKEELE